jgi:hypothetical protein
LPIRPADLAFIMRPEYTDNRPIEVRTEARPTLKAKTSNSPYPTRCQ